MPADVEFVNKSQEAIQLVATQNDNPSVQLATIAPGASFSHQLPDGWSGNFRHNGSEGITLFEISVKANDGNVYYDLSVIDGFNVPMKLQAPDGTYLEALNGQAPDAYLFPTDDTKTHGGPEGKFVLTFEY
ncbi:unnamed protein product [Adineta steineri]|uniref:Uncharacterized protein n=1 Tax=Adineta steineri TaxID=433720 RepID=A0A815VQX7_9BILA|nr:unnamed protein product [Adineta steineri]